ncbi:MAG TPA: Stp1/IreP family PP2C-type Ser/Thr phosphatase [Acidobacteriota bacterium]|nr:Stp1/IreP family PP2C-type Ser/Thr phosphatase [Acidobacteriota bacterium]
MTTYAALSDTGRKRSSNQDAWHADPERQFFILADGMGGHAAGEVAAELTVRTVRDFACRVMDDREVTWPFGYDAQSGFEQNLLRTSARLANARVCGAADKSSQYAGMGSTLVCLWMREGQAYYCHVGDSRLYRLRQGRLKQLTEDHSLVQEQMRAGLISPTGARRHALRHVVTRAIGSHESFQPDIGRRKLQEQDLFLLCSDGLSDRLEDPDITSLIAVDDLEASCSRLIEAANEAGGDDNITVVLVAAG